MRRFIIILGVAFALAMLGRAPTGTPEATETKEEAVAIPTVLPEMVAATPVIEPGANKDEELDESDSQAIAGSVPVFFPKAKVVARVSDPVDSEGRRKVIETVETSMKEKFVRVERTISRGTNGKSEVHNEVAMVANQLMLQKPDLLSKELFLEALSKAGALDVKELAEDSYLATFASQPDDPRALDGFMSKVHEVAGADLTVEPNYIRKIF